MNVIDKPGIKQAPKRPKKPLTRYILPAMGIMVTLGLTAVGWQFLAKATYGWADRTCRDIDADTAVLACNLRANLWDANPAQISFFKGRAAIHDGRDRDARTHLTAALEAGYAPGPANYWLGQSLQALEAYDKAEEAYTAAIAAGYSDRAKAQRGWTRLRLDDEASLKDFDEVLAGNEPGEPFEWIHYGRGRALLDLGRYEEAVAALDLQLELTENHSNAYAYRAGALQKLGRFDEALESANISLIQWRANKRAQRAKAETLHAMGRYEEALRQYNRMIKDGVSTYRNRIQKGRLQIETGDLDAARETFATSIKKAALELHPQIALMQVHCAEGAVEEAEDLLATIQRENPEMAWLAGQLTAGQQRPVCGSDVSRPDR